MGAARSGYSPLHIPPDFDGKIRGIKTFRVNVDHSSFVVKTKEDKTHSMTRPNDF